MAASNQIVTYEFNAKVEDALDGIRKLQKTMADLEKTAKVASAFNNLSKTFNSMSKGATKLSSGLRSIGSQLSNVHKQTSLLATAVKTLLGYKIGEYLANSTKSAIDYVETLNLFNVAMKDSVDVATEWVDSISSMYGLDPKWLMDATSMFYEMAYAVDMPDKAARTLSTSLTALSVDLASLFNVDVETVSDNLTSGMRGMSRAVLKYGMDLRATTVEQTALSLGITENYATMNEASREILRYITAINQAKDATGDFLNNSEAIGDFAKTLGSPANQLRILKEQIIQLGRAIGFVILGYLEPILPVINGIIMAIRVLIEVISTLLGLNYTPSDISVGVSGDSSGYEDAASGIGAIGDAADKTNKQLQRMLAPFDELNIIQENQTDSGSGASGIGTGSWGEVDPRLLEALEASAYTLEEVRLKAQDTKEAILAFFGITPDGDSWVYAPNVFKENLQNLLPQWTNTIEAMFTTDWGGVKTQLGAILSTLKEIASLTFEQVAKDFEAIFGITPDEALAQFIKDLPSNLAELNEWLQANKETIAQVAAKVLEFVIAWQLFTTLSPAIGGAFTLLSGAASGAGVVLQGLSFVTSPLGKTFTSLKDTILKFGTSLSAPPVGAFSGQLALGSSNAGTMATKVGLLATKFSGPLAAALTAVQLVGAALFIGGFVDWAMHSEKFKEQIEGIFDRLGSIFEHFKDLFNAVKNAFVTGCNFMAENFGGVYESIVAIIGNILDAFDGIIVFLTGVFEGDWKKALKGLGNVLIAILNAMGNAGAGVINAIIGILNIAIDKIVNGLISGINSILSAISDVLSFIGLDINLGIPDVPKIPTVTYTPIPNIPLATGGVVSSPTRALIGEGRYDEAVVPLEDSPQLEDMLSRFASKVEQTAGATEVRVFIGDKEWDAFTYKSAKRGERIVGSTPVKEGFYA